MHTRAITIRTLGSALTSTFLDASPTFADLLGLQSSGEWTADSDWLNADTLPIGDAPINGDPVADGDGTIQIIGNNTKTCSQPDISTHRTIG